jgi:hypothetical protein
VHVIYVSAPPELRAKRLARRAELPECVVDDTSITLRLSDDYVLPSAARTLYCADDLADLRESREWRQRIFPIENNFDDGNDRIDSALDTFVQAVIKPYSHDDAPPPAATATGAVPRAFTERGSGQPAQRRYT